MKTAIYYFSGTGNSLQVARELGQRLGGASLQAISENTGDDLKAEAVGIVFPVYLWSAPGMVLQFLKKLKADPERKYYFAVATYKSDAGDVIGQIKRKLDSSGIRMSAGFTIAMPGNNIVFYDAESSLSIDSKLEACSVKLEEVAETILSRKDSLPPEASAVDRLKTGLLHSVLVRTFRTADKRFWTNDDCSGCGICSRVCPAGNIKLNDERPIWQHNCQQCMACINFCPNRAIQCGKTTLNRQRYRNPTVDISDF